MTEKTEWEVVDAPAPGARSHGAGFRLPQLLREILGPHWKWKIAGAAVVAGLALGLVLAIAGVAIVTLTAVALVSFAIAKLRQWLRGKRDLPMRSQ